MGDMIKPGNHWSWKLWSSRMSVMSCKYVTWAFQEAFIAVFSSIWSWAMVFLVQKSRFWWCVINMFRTGFRLNRLITTSLLKKLKSSIQILPVLKIRLFKGLLLFSFSWLFETVIWDHVPHVTVFRGYFNNWSFQFWQNENCKYEKKFSGNV